MCASVLPDHRKETQTAVVWTCLPFIRSGQNHLARHSERRKKTRQTEEEVGRHYQGMDRPGVRQVPEGSGKQRTMEETGCKIIRGAPTTLAVKGLMMMIMNPYSSSDLAESALRRTWVSLQQRHPVLPVKRPVIALVRSKAACGASYVWRTLGSLNCLFIIRVQVV